MDRRPDPATDLPTGIHNPLLRAVAVNNGGSIINDDHPIELGVGQGGAECGSDIGSVTHVVPPAISYGSIATVSPIEDTRPETSSVSILMNEQGRLEPHPETQDSCRNSDSTTIVIHQHYSPGATSAAGLPHDARCVGHQAITCDACLGTGRHAHFPQRACGICGGSGVL